MRRVLSKEASLVNHVVLWKVFRLEMRNLERFDDSERLAQRCIGFAAAMRGS